MPSAVTEQVVGSAEAALYNFSMAYSGQVDPHGTDAELGARLKRILSSASPVFAKGIELISDEKLGAVMKKTAEEVSSPTRIAKEMIVQIRDALLEERYSAYNGIDGFNIARLQRVAHDPLPVTLHVNPNKSSRAAVAEELARNGVAVKPIEWCETGLQISNVKGAENEREIRSKAIFRIQSQTELTRSGAIYILDKTSMLPPSVVEIHPGMSVLDMCASPGGKSVIAAGRLQGHGMLIANEPNHRRNETLGENLRRFEIPRLEVTAFDGRAFGENHRERFDAVICDVPCSGTGMIRKKPLEIFREDRSAVGPLTKLQGALLEAAFLTTKVGGQFCYSTCSLDVEENEAVVAGFLSQYRGALEVISPHSAFKNPTRGMVHALDTAIRDSHAVQERFLPDCQPFEALRLWPHRHDCGGFFCVAFRKVG